MQSEEELISKLRFELRRDGWEKIKAITNIIQELEENGFDTAKFFYLIGEEKWQRAYDKGNTTFTY